MSNQLTIGIAASSSPFDRTVFKKGVRVLEKLGFNTFFRKDIFDQNRYLAGNDKRRADELVDLFCNSKIDAIMFARGGYGSQRIIPLLDIPKIKKHSKPIIGFSDITSLLAYLASNCSSPTFYGPVITMLGRKPNSTTLEYLHNALTTDNKNQNIPINDCKVLKSGEAEGKLVGGCLSIICSSIGTSYEPGFNDSILFIEDIGEKIYELDRMLTHLKNAGKLKNVKGIIIGKVILPSEEIYDLQTMVLDVLEDFKGPIISGFPAGHTDKFITLQLNKKTYLKAEQNFSPNNILCLNK